MAPAKKLINDADDVVDEMIKGSSKPNTSHLQYYLYISIENVPYDKNAKWWTNRLFLFIFRNIADLSDSPKARRVRRTCPFRLGFEFKKSTVFSNVGLLDFERVKHTQVALISGGGSGHEPAHAGFIG